MAISKICLRCKIDKPLYEFTKNSRRDDGLEYYCKNCRNNRSKIYRDNNKEKIKERDKIYRKNNWEKVYSKQKEYKSKNREKTRQYFSDYYQTNRDIILLKNKMKADSLREYSKNWKKNNRDKKLEAHYNRRNRERGAQGTFTNDEWVSLCEKYGNRCINPNCSNPYVPLTRDHVVPITKGGSNYISNIQPLCVSCNSSKHTDDVDYRVYYEF